MIGKKLLHYEIVAKLGAGGMGEVYRARDTKLGRDVALKVLPSKTAGSADRRKRFLREATAVAALKHPNIVTIHSVEDEQDTLFIVMELLEGKSLDHLIPSQGFNLTQLLDLSIPVAEAMAYAHEKGITHRDLKPGNIMLDEAGRPKVLDFGLAKLLETPVAPEAATVAADGSVTREGTVIGTASYMSPEQAEGKPTDPRSDIFSLGIILYEMATGRKPFQGDTTISTISSILKDTPPPVTDLNRSLPNHLGRVVQRCLAKDPGKRYQVALDLKNELEGLREESSGVGEVSPMPAEKVATSAGPGANRTRLLAGGAVVVALVAILAVWRPWSGGNDAATSGETATSKTVGDSPGTTARTERKMALVLPFENLGPPEDAYFAAGVTEEITNRLAAVSGLGVISRTTATQYDRTGKTLRQIGEELGVDYVLEGTVRWAKGGEGGGHVRISPRLVSVKNDLQIWSETYDQTIDDIFEVQTSIATSVIDELGVTLLGTERELVEERPTQSREAYDAYLQALDLQDTDWSSKDARIVELLERATRLDPKFLAAWFELTSHHAFTYHTGFDRTEARLAKAKAALQGAEAVDPDHPRTHLARGFYYYYGFREYDHALEEFLAAAEAVPNDVEARLAIGYIHRRQGKLEESVEDLRAGLDLDPQNKSALQNLAATYGALRQFEDADRLLDRLIEVSPDEYDAYVLKANLIVRWKGDVSAAREILTHSPGRGILYDIVWMELHTWERDFPAAMEAAVRIPETPPIFRAFRLTQIALIETRMDGRERARQSLESALAACQEILDGAPGNAQVHRLTAALYAYLGQDEAALKEVKLAVDLKAKDAFEGPQVLEDLAGVYAVAGRLDEAFDLLERLLKMQYAEPMTTHILQIQPVWDGLRGAPRYQELLEKYGEKIP